MAFQEREYEDVLTTQMHSLWFDETEFESVKSRRTKLYPDPGLLLHQERVTGNGDIGTKATKMGKTGSKQKKKWLNKLNVMINSYNKPVGNQRETTGLKGLSISTPFDFNHVGHISDDEAFGIDKLFQVKQFTAISPTPQMYTPPLTIQEEEDEEEDLPKKLETTTPSKPRGVSSYMTLPIEPTVSSTPPKVIKRSVSDRSVNSSLLFSRSNSVATVSTSVSMVPPSHQLHQMHKQSLSGNSLKSLMELEKSHQRSLSGNSLKFQGVVAKNTSPHVSYSDNSLSLSLVDDIQEHPNEDEEEEEEEEEKLDIPTIDEEITQFSFPSLQDSEVVEINTPVVKQDRLNWDHSPLSLMRSSWIYNDNTSLLETPKESSLIEVQSPNSSDDDLMVAAFKAASYSRRSRLSLQPLNSTRRESGFFADTRSIYSETVSPATAL